MVLLHAYHVPVINPDLPTYMFQNEAIIVENSAKEKLALAIEKLSKTFPNVHFSFKNIMGFAEDEILDYSEEYRTDLIVMGTKGASGLREILIGSITGSIVSKAKCPVLAIPENKKYKKPAKIVYASEMDPKELEVIDKVSRFAELFQAELDIVHVRTGLPVDSREKPQPYEVAELIRKNISYKNLSFSILPGVLVQETLLEFLKKEKTDMLAIATHHRGLLEKIFTVSLAKQISYHSPVPLLVYHLQEEKEGALVRV
ncbi:MAG: universal stress protein [Cytophagales bacterium]|nr:universal stress protein [Cytophagales bacterium]